MARYGRLLTDAQWEKIRPLLPKRPPRRRCQIPVSRWAVSFGVLRIREVVASVSGVFMARYLCES
jgi:transposase